MKKRGKADSYLDSIDLEILEYLDGANWNEGDLIGHSVLDIVEHLGIKHNNLKPHLDKLLNLKLIVITEKVIRDKDGKGEYDNDGTLKTKVVLATTRRNNKYWMENIFTGQDTEEENIYNECKIENEKYEEVLKLLGSIKKYLYDKEKLKSIDYDLRKSATQDRLLNLGIGTLSKKQNDLILKKKKRELIKRLSKN